MTKEDFDIYTGMLHCNTCGKLVPKIHIDHKKVHKNGDILRCNVCEWIKRHNGIPKIDNFSDEEIIAFLHFTLYPNSIYLNDIADELNRSIVDIIELHNILNLKSKKSMIRCTCQNCGKEMSVLPSVYLKNINTYCSPECYWYDKPNKIRHGEDSPFYNRIETTCTNCGKTIKVIPYNYNKKNKFGDNHNFCSNSCYWEYRSKYYTNEKSSMKNYEYSPELREKMRIIALNNSRNSNRFNTSIQLKVNSLLDELNIEFEREKIFKYYAVDNFLVKYNLIIEVMGDYWHGSPLVYNINNARFLSELQNKTIIKDKQKHSYILNKHNIEILYLWENDINNYPEMCKCLIERYISNGGILENYHSFNWNLFNTNLSLNENLIIPYQNMNTDEYRNLIIKKMA